MKIDTGRIIAAVIGVVVGYAYCWSAFAQKEERCQTYGGVLCEKTARVYIPNGEIQVVRKDNDTFEVGPIEAEQVAGR